MMVIAFTTCLLASPTTCQAREMAIYEPISTMACLVGAQGELARWRQDHPDWRVAEWRCRPSGRETELRKAAK